jgi:hypothetical protein
MIRVGDRVIVESPNGDRAGVVVYQRMRPPEFREPEAFSVQLDGVSHAGVIVPVEKCRLEVLG